MKKIIGYICIGVLFVASFIYYMYVRETEVVPEFVLTYAENQASNYPTTQGAYKFAELVEERTEGKVVIRIKHSGELGTEKEVLSQLQFGGIDLARLSLAALSDEVPRVNVLQLPYLYEDGEHMWNVLDSKLGESFLNNMDKAQVVGLSWYEAGTRSFYSAEEPIETIKDLEGKIIRIQDSEMMHDWVELFGGIPLFVPYTDVYEAFETGEIQVAENNWTSYVSEKHYEVAKYYTINEHARVPEVQLMSQKTWNQLPVQYRHIIQQCARESALFERELWIEENEKAKEKAISNGCIICEVSEEELQKSKEMMLPLYEKYCAPYMYLIEDIQKNY